MTTRKASEIYLMAVAILDELPIDDGRGMCYAIKTAAGGNFFASLPEVSLMEQYMAPTKVRGRASAWWGIHWSNELTDRRHCRILALLFMHQIAKDEERK